MCVYVYVHISLFLSECACTTIIDTSLWIFSLMYCCCVSIIIVNCICPPGALICLNKLISISISISYQSTDVIRKRHFYIHISRLMQSENGILLLFYIYLSHGNGKKNNIKTFFLKWVGCKKGGCCVLSPSTCGISININEMYIMIYYGLIFFLSFILGVVVIMTHDRLVVGFITTYAISVYHH